MFHRTSELFEFNKMLFIYLATGAIAILWVSRMILLKRIILKNTLFSPVMLLFLVSQIVSTVFSIDTSTSIFGYYGRFNGGLLSITSYILLYIACVSNFSGQELKNIVNNLFKYSLIGSILVMLWGIPSKFGYDLSCLLFTGKFDVGCWTEQFKPTIRMFSTLGQPNWLGAYLAINFFIGLYYYVVALYEKKKSYLYLAYLVLLTIILLYTRSRSALLALGIGLIFVMGYFVVRYKKRLKAKVFALPIALFLSSLLCAVLIAKTGISQIDRYISLPTSDKTTSAKEVGIDDSSSKNENITDSLSIRKIVWQGGFTLGMMYPLFGTGVETFAYSYNFVRPIAHNTTSEWDYVYNKAHNEYVNYFATTGFFGLVSYLIMLGVVVSQVVYLYKRNDLTFKERMMLLMALASYITILVTNFFGFSITVTNLYLYVLPVVVISIVRKKNFIDVPNVKEAHISSTQKRMLYGNVLLMVFVTWYLISYFFADVSYALGDNYSGIQDYNNSLTELYKAYNLRDEHIYADKISNVLAQVALLEATSKVEMNCVSHENVIRPCNELVEYYSNIATKGSPKNPYYYRTVARNNILLYQATNDEKYYADAIKAVKMSRDLAPSDPHYPYTQALFYLAKYENTTKPTDKESKLFENTTLPLVNFAIQLKPNYRDAYYAKVLILKQLKKKDEAKELIMEYMNKFKTKDLQMEEELKNL